LSALSPEFKTYQLVDGKAALLQAGREALKPTGNLPRVSGFQRWLG
jgi:hypothetical protein